MLYPNSPTYVGAIVIHDKDEVIHVTSSFLSLFNFDSRESVIGTSIRDYIAPSDHDRLVGQFDRIETGSTPALGLAITILDGSGDSREVITLSSPIKWEGQNRIQTLFFDIDSELNASGLVTKTMDSSPIGISIADARQDDEPLIYINDGFVQLTGYPREEVLGQNCRFLQGENTRPEPVAKVRNAIDNEEPVTVELRNYRKDGSMFWNRLSIQPVTNDDGDVTHFLGFQEDISAQKAYEQEQTLFETQANAVEKSLFITDVDGTIKYVNSQFEETTGFTATEAIGQTPRILNSGAQDSAFYEALWETITAGEVWEAIITNQRKTGERYTVEQKIVPITNGHGEITHFVSVEDDVTDQQFTEEVLGVMSRVLRHNVRNSVNAIQGYAEMLEDKTADPGDRAALRAIQNQAAQLEAISNRSRDIRELFRRRYEQHTMGVETIGKFVEQRRARHPDVDIDFSIDVRGGRHIQNGSLLQIAIDEALENAIVYSDQERPQIEVTVTELVDAGSIRIEIADDGPGIPQDEWNVILSGTETPLAHGSGIGLWMMYWTITALGGTLELTDNEPRGSIITYELPIGTIESDLIEQNDQSRPNK